MKCINESITDNYLQFITSESNFPFVQAKKMICFIMEEKKINSFSEVVDFLKIRNLDYQKIHKEYMLCKLFNCAHSAFYNKNLISSRSILNQFLIERKVIPDSLLKLLFDSGFVNEYHHLPKDVLLFNLVLCSPKYTNLRDTVSFYESEFLYILYRFNKVDLCKLTSLIDEIEFNDGYKISNLRRKVIKIALHNIYNFKSSFVYNDQIYIGND